VATSRELAAQALKNIDVDPALALRLALAAFDTKGTPQAVAALRESTAAFRQRAILRADSQYASAAQVSPDGRRILTGGSDGTAILWNAESHREIARWEAGHKGLWAARFGSDGRIVLGFEDGTVAVANADLGSPQPVGQIKGQMVNSAAITPDGGSVVAGFNDGVVRVFAIAGDEPPRELPDAFDDALSVDVSPNGGLVAGAGLDGTVRLWNLADGASQTLHDGQDVMRDVAFSPDGKWLLATGDDGFVRRWDTLTRREHARTSATETPLYTLAISRDGRRFAAGGEDGNTFVFAAVGTPPIAVLRGQGAWVQDVGFGLTDDVVTTAFDNGTAWLWDAGDMNLWKIPLSGGGIDFNADGRLVVTPSAAGPISVWNTDNGRLVNRLPGSSDSTATSFSPVANEVLIADGYSPNVRLWRIDEDSTRVLFRAPGAGGVDLIRYDPRGKRIAYVDTDGRLAVRNVNSPAKELTLRGAPKAMSDVKFNADGSRVAVISDTGVTAVWRVDRPNSPERRFRTHNGSDDGFAFAREGRIATAGSDKVVRVWPPDGGRPVVMTGHTLDATDVAFTRDGSKVLSSSFDGTVRLWDARTGNALGVIESTPRALYSMRLSTTGKIALLAPDGIMRVFRCEVCGPLQQVEDHARGLSPRPLTEAEKQRYVGATG
jgi:WD40 repeat protein